MLTIQLLSFYTIKTPWALNREVTDNIMYSNTYIKLYLYTRKYWPHTFPWVI